jgi:sortase A
MGQLKPVVASALMTVFLASALWQWGQVALITGKAWLAHGLISAAWEKSKLESGINVKPWPWADTWPVMSLVFSEEGGRSHTYPVLNGSTGNVLAFAPGLLPESALPGHGPVFIAGHRDTHFSRLESLLPGAALLLEDSQGKKYRYVVSETAVLDTASESLVLSPDDEALYLITCFPFDALVAGGSLRYLVRAVPAQGIQES